MKGTDIFKDKKFIRCLKKETYNDIKINYIKIFDKNNKIVEENINKVTYIDCHSYWITNINGISIFKNLKILNLSNNQIKKLPKEIKKLENLEEIDLYNNRLQYLPKEIWKLKKLKILNLKNNQLQSLLDKIDELTNLEKLDLSYNRIKEIPKEIWKLKKLKILDVSYNRIEKLPKEINELINLEKLNLSNNKIKEIPEKLGKLINLEGLNLGYNQLQELPKEILKLNKLQRIWLHNAFDLNNLNQKPEELLDIFKKLKDKNILGDNDLEYLEEEIYPVLAEKIKEKYWITNLKQIKDNLNFDNFSF